jgi:hypothetical protein
MVVQARHSDSSGRKCRLAVQGCGHAAFNPLAVWAILDVCTYGLGQICEVIFDIIAAIVEAKTRQN